MGVKFNFLKDNQISTRYVQFLKHTEVQNDYTLRVELYASPQGLKKTFFFQDILRNFLITYPYQKFKRINAIEV